MSTSDAAEEYPTDEQWQAILSNDAAYENKFIYAVKTTGIFCRPSCKSKPPKRDNVLVFHNADAALAAKFRPCKRCKPTGGQMPDEEWIDQVAAYIQSNYDQPITLQLLADLCHGSPYHLHRIFKRVRGVTPTEYVQQIRIAKAKEYLAEKEAAISLIAWKVGLPNTSYFITLFKKRTGFTPVEYRFRLQQNQQQ